MLTQAERQGYIEKIKALPAQIEALVQGLTPEQLTARPLDGEWSVAQNVHHLVDSHVNAYIRCRLIKTEDHPPLKPYRQELWAELADSTPADMTDSFMILKGLHNRWTTFFSSLEESDWERGGVHADLGFVTLDYIVQSYAEHGEAHIEQITRTKAAL